MAKPDRLNGTASLQADGRNKQPTKLSSGILGMKFMQASDSESSPGPVAAEEKPSSPPRSRHGYFTEEDPGRWALPGALRKDAKKKQGNRTVAPSSVSYADIYGNISAVSGRRTYGADQKRIDAEDMVTDRNKGDAQRRKQKAAPSKKRLSSEHESGLHSKQRRKT